MIPDRCVVHNPMARRRPDGADLAVKVVARPVQHDTLHACTEHRVQLELGLGRLDSSAVLRAALDGRIPRAAGCSNAGRLRVGLGTRLLHTLVARGRITLYSSFF